MAASSLAANDASPAAMPAAFMEVQNRPSTSMFAANPTTARGVATLVQAAEVFLAAEAMQGNAQSAGFGDGGTLFCPMGACTSRFDSRTGFEEHMKTAHPDMYQVICLKARPVGMPSSRPPREKKSSSSPLLNSSSRGRRKRSVSVAAGKAAPSSTGYSDRYRKSIMFNGLKMGDAVRIRSNNRVCADAAALSSASHQPSFFLGCSQSLSLFQLLPPPHLPFSWTGK